MSFADNEEKHAFEFEQKMNAKLKSLKKTNNTIYHDKFGTVDYNTIMNMPVPLIKKVITKKHEKDVEEYKRQKKEYDKIRSKK